MRKLLSVLICMIMLCGCTRTAEGSLQKRLEQECAAAVQGPLSSANHRKQYYSYYLDPSIGRLSSTGTGNEFIDGNARFVMNLDVASIINEKYYPNQKVSHDYAFSGSIAANAAGTMTCADGTERSWQAIIEHSEGDEYLIHMTAGHMSFEGFATDATAPALAAQMLRISRSVTVDTQEVLAAFTTREGIDYVGNPVELFEDIAPENGSIEELLIGYDGQPRQEEEQPQEESTEEEAGSDSGENP